ncbi:MAG: DNA-processing protein DprA [Candidatus Coproplasma sp.]
MIYTKKEVDLIVANSITELNYTNKKLFLASQNDDIFDREKYANALKKNCGENTFNKALETFLDETYRKKTLQELDKREIVCVTYKSTNYPELLKNTPTPPLVLYARGNLKLLEGELFAIVGSRKTTASAYEECKKISRELSEKFVIVTGVADGADSAAAYGALECGNVVCVLPGGHDSNCSTNVKMLKDVEEKGLTISEFPFGQPARKYTYFLRNRIIAGLCKGVLVVSAAQKSGALNTASYAADYSREVFAFPYSPGITSGEGCNNLIKNGAYLCDRANDVFSVFGYEATEEGAQSLDKDERAVLTLLKEEGETHLEIIAEKIGKQLFEVSAVCAMLEIKGLIVKTGGNKYSAL